MKATDLVVTQHREVEKLFEQLSTADESDKKGVREELAQNLVAHAVIEEEHLYPALKTAMREEVERSYVEHGIMMYALAHVLSIRPADETFRAKLSVLKDLVMRHVREEESEVLKKAETALGNERLLRLGEEMEARFNQVKAKGYKAFLRHELAKYEPQARPGRAVAKKTVAAKAPAAAKRAAARRTPARKPQEMQQPAKRSAAPAARKSGQQRARSPRASSR